MISRHCAARTRFACLAVLAACVLAATAPPKFPDSDQVLSSLNVALGRVEAGASLNLPSLGNPGALPHRHIHLTWDVASESAEEIAILGAPRVVEAVADGGRDLLTTSSHRVFPDPTRPPYFTGPRRQGEPVVLSATVSFEHAGPLPARLDRVTLEVDVAARGRTVAIDLPPELSDGFTPICGGVEARVALIGVTDADRGADRFVLVEYRLAPAGPLGHPASDGAPDDASGAAVRSDAAHRAAPNPGDAFRAPVVASVEAINDMGRPLGRAGLHLEASTTTGRFGMVVLLLPPQSEAVAIRIEANPAAEVRRVRLRASNIDTGG